MRADSMQPDELSARLRQLASYVDVSRRPSASFLRSQIAAALVATDQSLAQALGAALAEQTAKLMPEEFDGSQYDTSLEKGKGHKDGYVSWGMKPTTWDAADLIGGILFRCQFDPGEFRSEAPEDREGWKGHSKGGGVVTMSCEAGYYNKRYGGGVKETVPLGTCTVQVGPTEDVEEAYIDDPGKFKSGVAGLIQQIAKSPPDEALSESRKRKDKNLAPNTTPQALMRYLNKNNRTEVKRSEINDVVRNVVERLERAPGTVLEEVNKFFRDRGMPIDEAA